MAINLTSAQLAPWYCFANISQGMRAVDEQGPALLDDTLGRALQMRWRTKCHLVTGVEAGREEQYSLTFDLQWYVFTYSCAWLYKTVSPATESAIETVIFFLASMRIRHRLTDMWLTPFGTLRLRGSWSRACVSSQHLIGSWRKIRDCTI